MKKFIFLIIVLVSWQAQAQKEVASTFAKAITAKELKKKLTVIAGPEMEGRETATAGQRKAAAFIEATFKKAGLLPGTATGYQMIYPVYQDSLESASVSINGSNYVLDKDFAVNASSFFTGSWTAAEIIFAAYGDSAQYSGLDVKDKWLMLADNAALTNREKRERTALAKKKGIKGLLLVSKDFPKSAPSSRKSDMYLSKTDGDNVPVIYISTAAAASILKKSSFSLDSTTTVTRGVYDANLQVNFTKSTISLQSSNVIGVLPGTDKKGEYVFITGHYDHLGKKDNVIYYGADDDGSGTTSVLQLAETFSKAKAKGKGPRRTMVFMTVSGEEKGLWGSEYYTDHPVFPLDSTSVDLNIDMVGRIDPGFKGDSTNYVYVIGDDKLSSDLVKITDSVNHQYAHMELDRRYNDLKDKNRFYYRSDHYNFAKKGVPIIFYFNGVHADYHKPTDTIDKINFDVMTKRVKLVFYTAWNMANRDNMLLRDIPLK